MDSSSFWDAANPFRGLKPTATIGALLRGSRPEELAWNDEFEAIFGFAMWARLNQIRLVGVPSVMRPDMDKVIVERPRLGGGVRRPKGIRKRERLAMMDLTRSREGYRQRWTSGEKSLNEHLSPLRRYLQSQVGRPWNKVHSEISRHLRLDSAVQSHVLDHLWDYVEVKTRLIDGEVCSAAGVPLVRGGWFWRPLFYVCPKSGVLKAVRRPGRQRRAVAKPAYLKVAERRQWQKVEGIWFEIELAPAAGVSALVRDVMLKAAVVDLNPRELYAKYGDFVFATRKRQLGKRAVRIAERRVAELEKARSG